MRIASGGIRHEKNSSHSVGSFGEAADGVIRLLTERYEKHKYATIMEKGNPASFLPKFDTTVATC